MKTKVKAALLQTIAEIGEVGPGAKRLAIFMRVDRVDGVRAAATRLHFAGCLPRDGYRQICAAADAVVDRLNAAAQAA